jgi:hypothetical protein
LLARCTRRFPGALRHANDCRHGVDNEAAYVELAAKKVKRGRDRKDDKQQEAAHVAGGGNEKQERGKDFASAKRKADPRGKTGFLKVMNRRR